MTTIFLSLLSHLISYLLHFKVIRDKPQKKRVYLNSFNAHPLGFKVVRNTVKCIWHDTHYFVIHFLHPKIIREK